jgi:hypothetical protein
MTLMRLAGELDETARQTAELVEGIVAALETLCSEDGDPKAVRAEAIAMIVSALQGQDRIEQRCRDLAHAVRRFARLPADAPAAAWDEIWASLVLDELRLPHRPGFATRRPHGEIELF